VVFAPFPTLTLPTQRSYSVAAKDTTFTPAVLYANPGDTVTIRLTAKDVAHGLSIDGYPVDLHAEPGQSASVTFVASRAGVFKFRCSIACGNLHPFMTGRFEVGPNLLLLRAAALAVLAALFGAWKVFAHEA
jgi:heme/copper-type cytochrome/quinol oxidase subunit 2